MADSTSDNAALQQQIINESAKLIAAKFTPGSSAFSFAPDYQKPFFTPRPAAPNPSGYNFQDMPRYRSPHGSNPGGGFSLVPLPSLSAPDWQFQHLAAGSLARGPRVGMGSRMTSWAAPRIAGANTWMDTMDSRAAAVQRARDYHPMAGILPNIPNILSRIGPPALSLVRTIEDVGRGIYRAGRDLVIGGLAAAGAGLAAFATVAKLSVDKATETAGTLASIRANTGIGFGQGYGILTRNRLFGISQSDTASMYKGNAMNPFITGVRSSALGFPNPSDPNFIVNAARNYQAGAQGPMGRMLQNAKLNSLFGGQAPDSVMNAVNIPVAKLQAQQDFGTKFAASAGVNPEMLKRYAEDVPLFVERIGFMFDSLKVLFATKLLPVIEPILSGVANFIAAHVDDIANGIRDTAKWLVNDLPPMLMRFGAAVLGVFSGLLQGGSVFLKGVSDNAVGIVENFKAILQGVGLFASGLLAAAAFIGQIAYNAIHGFKTGFGADGAAPKGGKPASDDRPLPSLHTDMGMIPSFGVPSGSSALIRGIQGKGITADEKRQIWGNSVGLAGATGAAIGGAAWGAGVGTMIAPGVGTLIGAGVGGLGAGIAGFFGGRFLGQLGAGADNLYHGPVGRNGKPLAGGINPNGTLAGAFGTAMPMENRGAVQAFTDTYAAGSAASTHAINSMNWGDIAHGLSGAAAGGSDAMASYAAKLNEIQSGLDKRADAYPKDQFERMTKAMEATAKNTGETAKSTAAFSGAAYNLQRGVLAELSQDLAMTTLRRGGG